MNITMSNKQYQAQDDLRVLRHHAEIIADPKRHAAAKTVAKQNINMLQKISAPKAPVKAPVKRK